MIFDYERDEFVFIIKTNPIDPLPDVRRPDGGLILPNEYGWKLEENSIIMVDVHFELQVSFVLFDTNKNNNQLFFREIGPCHSRDYQLILNSMQSLLQS